MCCGQKHKSNILLSSAVHFPAGIYTIRILTNEWIPPVWKPNKSQSTRGDELFQQHDHPSVVNWKGHSARAICKAAARRTAGLIEHRRHARSQCEDKTTQTGGGGSANHRRPRFHAGNYSWCGRQTQTPSRIYRRAPFRSKHSGLIHSTHRVTRALF